MDIPVAFYFCIRILILFWQIESNAVNTNLKVLCDVCGYSGSLLFCTYFPLLSKSMCRRSGKTDLEMPCLVFFFPSVPPSLAAAFTWATTSASPPTASSRPPPRSTGSGSSVSQTGSGKLVLNCLLFYCFEASLYGLGVWIKSGTRQC